MTKQAFEGVKKADDANGARLHDGSVRVAPNAPAQTFPVVNSSVNSAPAGMVKTPGAQPGVASGKVAAAGKSAAFVVRDADKDSANPDGHEKAADTKKLAMADAESLAAANGYAPLEGQASAPDAGGGSSDDDDGEGGSALPLILGGVVLAGGIAAAAGGGGGGSGGGGSNPANTAPVVAATQAVAGTEDKASTVTVAATDANSDTLTYTAGAAGKGAVTGGAGGVFTYTPNANFNGADTFTVTVSDGKGGTATQTVTVNVAAVNDAPTATAATAAATEDAAAVTGKVTGADVDGDTLTYSLNAPVAGLTIAADGSYSFNPADAAYQSLAVGETKAVVANYTVSDGKGGTATSTLTVTVTGVNDAPVAKADVGTATEDGAIVSGSVATNDSDVDNGATLTYAVSGTAPAGFTLNTDGSYTFDPASYDSIAAGKTQDVVANYTVSDGKGGTATSALTVTVTGVNDAPVAVAAAAAATEDGAIVTGKLAATDVDAGDTLTYSVVGTAPAGLTLNADGSFSFDPASYDSLAAGKTQDVVATYLVTDGSGATSQSTLTVTVTGVNDAPVAVNDAFSVAEDTAISGTVAKNDSDVDVGDTLTYALTAAAPAGLNFSKDGTFSFNADDPSYDKIAAGKTQDVSFSYTVSDGNGGSATATATVTVVGSNDAPVAVAAKDAATEDGAIVSGKLAATDVDAGDTLTYTVVGAAPAGLTLNADGSYSFDPASYDSLAAGKTQDVVATYMVKDGSGATSQSTLTVTVTGINDDPVITSTSTAAIDENVAAGTTVYTATATDVDVGDSLAYGLTGTDASLLSINATTGVVTIKSSPNYEAKQSYSFNVTAFDGIATVSKAVTLNVNNLVDVLNIDQGNANTPVTIDASGVLPADILDVNYQFDENAGLPSDVIIQNFGANDYIQFSPNLGNYNFNNSGGDLIITQNNGGVVSTINIDNILNPNLQLANNEAAVEAALNAALGTTGVDYLRSPSFAAATRSADVDNDNNSNTEASATGPNPLTPIPGLDAAAAAVNFTENANIANFVRISNFGSDDHITVTNAASGSYNFVVEPNNQDLTITFNNGGTINSITLEGIFSSPPPFNVAFSNSEAVIEQFVGYDFFSFA